LKHWTVVINHCHLVLSQSLCVCPAFWASTVCVHEFMLAFDSQKGCICASTVADPPLGPDALRIRLWTAYSKRWSCWDGKPLAGGNSNMFGIFSPGEMIQSDWRSYFSNGWLNPPPRPRPCWNSICYDPVTIFVSDDIAKVIHPTVWQQRRKTFFENIVTHIFPAMFRQSLKKSFKALYNVMYMNGQAPSFAPECNIPWRVY